MRGSRPFAERVSLPRNEDLSVRYLFAVNVVKYVISTHWCTVDFPCCVNNANLLLESNLAIASRCGLFIPISSYQHELNKAIALNIYQKLLKSLIQLHLAELCRGFFNWANT